MKKAVVFDLDGTLINSLPDIAGCMNEALRALGLPAHTQDEYRYFVGRGSTVLSQRAVGAAHPELAEKALAIYRPLYAAHCYDASYVYDGVRDMLSSLRAAGLRLAVLSNKDAPDADKVVAHYFPDAPFEIVRGRLPGVPPKPDPASALALARDMALDARDVWYLGDTPVDCQTCRDAGMRFIGALWGFRSEAELREAGAVRLARTPDQALAWMLEAP